MWQQYAACKGRTETMFPESDRYRAPRDFSEALAICSECPVRHPCLNYALDHGEVHGVWGGKTETQRARLRTRRYHEWLAS
jgi:WhiB family redox-sensing transcriptional regulator